MPWVRTKRGFVRRCGSARYVERGAPSQAMLPTVYRRDDARWIVLPSVLREAPSLRDEGSLQRVGCANIELDRTSVL